MAHSQNSLGSLPAGLKLDATTGTISGRPVTSGKDQAFIVTCTNNFGPPQPSDLSGRLYITIKAKA